MDRFRLTHTAKEGKEGMGTWRVAEFFSEARDAQRGTEDGLLIADHCVAVLDGVSTPGFPQDVGETPGQLAVRVAMDALREHTRIRPEEVVDFLTERIAQETGYSAHGGTPSFVFAAFFPGEQKIVRVGDCSFLIDGVGSNPGLAVDRAKGFLRKRELHRYMDRGVTPETLLRHDPSRARMNALRDWQRYYANNASSADFGYGVINGEPVPQQFVEYISVPADTRTIILATDGYPPSALCESLRETEKSLVEHQRRDPLGIEGEPSVRALLPQGQQHATDDRTYVCMKRA